MDVVLLTKAVFWEPVMRSGTGCVNVTAGPDYRATGAPERLSTFSWTVWAARRPNACPLNTYDTRTYIYSPDEIRIHHPNGRSVEANGAPNHTGTPVIRTPADKRNDRHDGDAMLSR
jgi:hypothetical protein